MQCNFTYMITISVETLNSASPHYSESFNTTEPYRSFPGPIHSIGLPITLVTQGQRLPDEPKEGKLAEVVCLTIQAAG